MPSFGRWVGIGVLLASPMAAGASTPTPPQPPPTAPVAPPSVALLEFLGDWNREERELLNMDTQTEKQAQPASPTPGDRNAP